jgi:hypothetical protein
VTDEHLTAFIDAGLIAEVWGDAFGVQLLHQVR